MKEKDTILSEWLQGQVSDEEVKSLFPDLDLDSLKETLSIQDNFEITATSPDMQWEVFESKLPSKNENPANRNLLKWILLLAIISLSALSIYFIFYKANTLIEADSNEILNYALEDGSTIKLWPGSSFSFNESKYMEERTINLTGEAFFDVQKGNSFLVKTKAGEIEVLGTSFNVWAADKNNVDVKCYTGRVRVSNNSKESVTLTSGKKVRISENEIEEMLSFDIEKRQNNISLKHYDKAKIAWVFADLKNLHKVEFKMKKELKNKRFSGAIPMIELEKALSYLCETMQWTYEIQNENIFVTSKN